VGAQVSTWSYQIQYVQSYTGLGERNAGYWLTGGLVAFTVGRFFSTWLLRFVSGSTLLGVYAGLNAVICATAVLKPGWLGVGCLIAVSFFMSMMFPTIFALGIRGLGTHTKTGGALIVMGIVGGALITLVMGRTADGAGVAHAYLVPAACFLLVALYAFMGSQPAAGDLDPEPAN
jgi:FHS family L-fucose permease-like MFS transporter